MVAMAQKVGLIWPNLTGHQMANIFAYLQTLEYANPPLHEKGVKTSQRGGQKIRRKLNGVHGEFLINRKWVPE
jgi:hypothetical protein